MEGEVLSQKRQQCEIYSRIVGYIRPVDQWNPGKQAEYYDRNNYNVEQCAECK